MILLLAVLVIGLILLSKVLGWITGREAFKYSIVVIIIVAVVHLVMYLK